MVIRLWYRNSVCMYWTRYNIRSRYNWEKKTNKAKRNKMGKEAKSEGLTRKVEK